MVITELPLPWKSGASSLPDNHAQAYKRLMSIKRRLETNDFFKAMHVSTMNSYIDKGYAESVPMREQNKTGKNEWYLPHHGVLKTKGAAKLRVVFDSAATCGGTSLNKQLNTGPDLLNNFFWSYFDISTVQLHPSGRYRSYVSPGEGHGK